MDNNKIDAITKRFIESNRKAGHHVPPQKVRAAVVKHAIRRDRQNKN